jgi:hypothetical protein
MAIRSKTENYQRSDTEQERSIRDQQEQEIDLNEILTNYLKNNDYFVKDFIAYPNKCMLLIS